MKKIFNKKFIIPIFLFLALVGYFCYKNFSKKDNGNQYVLGKAEKDTIVSSVSGTGQISTLDEINIKPKVSGEVSQVYIEVNQKVNQGDLLFELDKENYQEAIDSAQLALDNAEISLDNLRKNKSNAEKDLEDDYRDAFNAISSAFNGLPDIIDNLKPIFTESSIAEKQADIDYYQTVTGFYNGKSFPQDEKKEQFLNLKEKYQTIRYNFFSFSFSPENIDNQLDITLNLIKEIADFAHSGRDIIYFYKETLTRQSLIPPISLSITEAQLTKLNSITTSLDQTVSSLNSLSKKIDQDKTSILNYEKNIQTQEKTIKQKENDLFNARENFANCSIRSPFNGIISQVNVKKGDSVSSGTSLATLVTTEKIAEISLNEIDAAEVKINQKATLTFDALPDLTLTGKVSEIDTVGTVSQGVVSYGVKISLDNDLEKIKPGMSVNAEIIIEAKTDVLALPNNAIKTQGDNRYVELIEGPDEVKNKLKIGSSITLPKEIQIKNQPVEIGISNDTMTEILSGLEEGDIFISSTITKKNKTSQTQSTQQFQIPGMGSQIRVR